jgi:hypothetical protein
LADRDRVGVAHAIGAENAANADIVACRYVTYGLSGDDGVEDSRGNRNAKLRAELKQIFAADDVGTIRCGEHLRGAQVGVALET